MPEKQAEPIQKSALIVLGMHRSGTSALTRCMGLLGWTLPRKLMLVQKDNPKGFWEPMPIVRLNNRILEDSGSTWDNIKVGYLHDKSPIDSTAEIAKSNEDRYLDRAVEMIHTSFDPDSPKICIKDPRIGLFWPLWKHALEKAGYKVNLLIIIRNPLEVAASLKNRNGLEWGPAAQLWLQYNLTPIAFGCEDIRMIVRYADLIENPVEVCQTIQNSLTGDSRIPDSAAQDVMDFIDPVDRHFVQDDASLDNYPLAPRLLRRSYALVGNWNKTSKKERCAAGFQLLEEYYELLQLTGAVKILDSQEFD